MTNELVVMTPADLEAIFRKAIEDTIAKAIACNKIEVKAPVIRHLTLPMLQKRFNIGRHALVTLIESGKLPATARRMRGGNGWSVLEADAVRVLGAPSV